jgi:hypothetical protein
LSDAQRMPSRKDGIRVGDEGKAVGSAQAPAALLSPHNVTIRSVITITESRFFKPVKGLRNKPGQLRDIRCDPPRLIFAEQLCRLERRPIEQK